MLTNMNLVRKVNQLKQIKAEVQARRDRSLDDSGHLSSEVFGVRNPDIELPMGQYLKERAVECGKLQKEIKDYEDAEGAMSAFDDVVKEGQKIRRAPNPTDSAKRRLADEIFLSDDFTALQSGKAKELSQESDITLKALFETTTTGAADSISVESTRIADMVMLARTRVSLLDLIPQEPTTDAVVKYDEEVSNLSAASAIAQGAVYAESAFRYDERSVSVSKSGCFINVSEEALADVPELRARLENALNEQMLRRIQDDIIGVTAGPVNSSEYQTTQRANNTNITGFLELVGIQTIDGNAAQMTGEFLNPYTLLEQAAERIWRVGQADADAIVMTSQDWLQISTLQTTTGAFVARGADSPIAVPTPRVISGLPVVLCNALPENTVLVGSFGDHASIRDRQQVQVRIQEAQTATALNQPTKPSGRFNIYADARYAFYARRPSAFCTITDFGVPAP